MDAPLHLRPMSVGEILDRSFRLYRNHFLKFFLAVLVCQSVAFVLLQVYLARCFMPFYHELQKVRLTDLMIPEFPTEMLVTLAIGSVVFFASYSILSLLYLGALVHLVNDTFLGKPAGIVTAYGRTLRQLWPLIRVNVVKLNILGIAFLFWLFPMSLFLTHRLWWVVAAWAIPGLLPMLSAYLWLALVSIVLLLERRTLWDSLRRSGRLMFKLTEQGFTRTNAFRISVLLLVIFMVKTVMLWVSQAPFALWKVFEAFRDPSLLGQYNRSTLDSIFELINMVMQSATAPFGLAMLVLFYYDIRIRKEGLDLTLRLQRLRDQLPAPQQQKA